MILADKMTCLQIFYISDYTLYMLLLVIAVNSNIIEHEKWTATSGISEMMLYMLEWSLAIPQYILIKTRVLPESTKLSIVESQQWLTSSETSLDK